MRLAAIRLTALLILLLCPLAAHAERYHYDTAGRLIRVIYDDLSSITYTYDDNGNILSRAVTAPGLPGDADLDGDIDDDDLSLILASVLAGGQPYSATADCNLDDRVSVLDLVCAVTAMGSPS